MGCCQEEEFICINGSAPDFETKAYHEDTTKTIHLHDYRGKWVVLLFYSADFTFICPTELGDFADHYPEFKKLNAEVLSVSTDTGICSQSLA